MSDSIIEQVKRLAEAQKAYTLGELERTCTLSGQIVLAQTAKPYFNVLGVAEDLITEESGPLDLDNVRHGVKYLADASAFDWEHLLAHMQAQQAVVDAARKAKHYLEHRTTCKYLWDGVECDCGYISVSAALDAALSRIAALTGEKK